MTAKTRSLAPLIEGCRFDYVDPNVKKLFRYEEPQGEIGVKNFGRWMKAKDVIAELKKEGLRPATATEMLAYIKQHPEWRGWMVALGSVATFEGSRRVCYSWLGDDGRVCGLSWFDGDFSGFDWFAFGRESSDAKDSALETLPSVLEINGMKYTRV